MICLDMNPAVLKSIHVHVEISDSLQPDYDYIIQNLIILFKDQITKKTKQIGYNKHVNNTWGQFPLMW